MFVYYLFLEIFLISIIFSVFSRLSGRISGEGKKGHYIALIIGASGVILFGAIQYLCYFIFGFLESKEMFFALTVLTCGISSAILKFIFLLLIVKNKKNHLNAFTIISYSIAAAMGFAASENVIWVNILREYTDLHILTSVPIHASAAVLSGYYLSKAYSSGIALLKNFDTFKALLFAVILHALNEFFLIGSMFSWYFLPFWSALIFGGIFLTVKLSIKAWREN